MAGSAAVNAQTIAGEISGNVPAGDSVVANNLTTGLQREGRFDSKACFTLRALPAGVYNLVLEKNGKPVLQRLNVPVAIDRGIKSDFDCETYDAAK